MENRGKTHASPSRSFADAIPQRAMSTTDRLSPDGLDAAGDNATGVPRKAEAIPAVPINIARRRHARGGLMVVAYGVGACGKKTKGVSRTA